jgi:tetratricopeptide (TPR) repeat protein
MAKVYVSSTVADLEAERREVMDWLVAAGHQPVHSYRPDSETVRESCLDDVDTCDLYVLILGHRYGFQPEQANPEKLSITQLEFRRAKQSRVPRIALIRTSVPDIRLSDLLDPQKAALVRSFQEEVRREVRTGEFSDLKGLIQGLSTGVYSELDKLRAGTGRQPPSPDWPKHVLESLSTQLNNDFVGHMQAREDLSPDQARARYVQGLIKLRVPPKDQKSPQEGPLEDFLASDGVPLLVVGSGGSGKTTMLKHLAAEGARRATQNSRAPIFVYLRLASFDRGDGGLDLLLDRVSMAAHLDRKEFEVRWREGRRPVVLLLDGLNEVARAFQPSCTQALWTLLQNSPPVHRYVITSRPGAEFEAVASYSTENQRLRVADILKFEPQQVQEYLKAQGRTGLQSRISGRLEDLASNPFLLWAITRTLANSQQESLLNRGSLFRALIDRYIFGVREQSKPKPRPTDYNYELVKKPVLAQLALRMTEDGVTVVPDGPALWQQVAKYLLAADQQREQGRQLPPEAEIFMPKDYSAVSFLRETVENGVLVRGSDGLRFMHESVQEYFAAVALDTWTVEDLERGAPSLKLARLDARGPIFEAFVAWAGLSGPEKVTALVERLQEKHPLLAVHMAVEAGVPEELQKLRHQFLSFTASEHEQRRLLGAMGLAVAPSEEPAVVARLIEMLDIGGIVGQALKAVPTKNVLSALVKTATTRSEDVDRKEAKLLRELAVEHTGPMAEVLLDVWSAGNSQRDRVAGLAAFLDARESWEKDRRPLIRETLLMLSVEAELGGNLQRSADLDALRQHAYEAVITPTKTIGKKLVDAWTRQQSLARERDKLAAAFAEKDDAALELLVRDGELLQRDAALGVLVGRGGAAAVVHVVEAALRNPKAKWLNVLESLPREPARGYLANRKETLEGELLERALLLAGLLADKPPRAVLERVFDNSGKDLRAFAVRAAGRAGAEGVELLIEQLSNEANPDVLEACVRALGGSRSPVAFARLLDMLFGVARQDWSRWPYRDAVSDSESAIGMGSSDHWATLIHNVLADAGAVDMTLERLERDLHSRRPGDAYDAVVEARRWLPAARAVELLWRAMTHEDLKVRRHAQWSLACAGNADAWRAFLQTALDTSPSFVVFAQDPAWSLEAIATDPATRDPLIAASQSVLRPALADSDGRRRAAALELMCCLPEQWVEAAWRREALAAAEQLIQSVEPHQRVRAVLALHRFAYDGDERILTILLNDPEEAVIRRAYEMLGDRAAPRLEERLQSVLHSGDCAAAQHIAGIVGTVLKYFKYSEKLNAVRDTVGKWLETGDRDQCVTALLALAVLHPENGDVEEWKELSKRARAAFQRHGLEDTWRRFAVHAPSLSESHRNFVYLVLGAFGDNLEQLTSLATWAAKLWPDDLQIIGTCVLVDILRGNRDQAAQKLTAVEERFHDSINHMWVGDCFAELDRPHDALRNYRIAVEHDPTDDVAHFKAGWFAFVTGDFEGSIESTRRSLKLQPTSAMAQFNLGLALLARRDTAAGEAAYRRGVALARRRALANARQELEGVLGDFALLPELPDSAKNAVDRIRTWLQEERDRLGVG